MQHKRLVLLGAGHTHVLAMREIAAAAQKMGVSVTLVSRDKQTPYSGLLPAAIAGLMPRSKIMLDVAALAHECKIEYEQQNAIGLDLNLRQVVLETGACINYDYLSINVGGNCEGFLQEEGGDVMPVKPVEPFLDWLENWQDMPTATCAVIGAGVAGAEVALSIDARMRRSGRVGGVYLVGKNKDLIPAWPNLAKHVRAELEQRGISQVLGAQAKAVAPGYLRMADGSEYRADHVVVAVGVKAWPVMRDAGLETDEKGFVLVNSRLQSCSHPNVLASGDCATVAGTGTPKAGVFAVRQAPTLAHNIIAMLRDQPLRPWITSPKALAIISCGNRKAIAYRGGQVLKGRPTWWWKCYLDNKFMRKFA